MNNGTRNQEIDFTLPAIRSRPLQLITLITTGYGSAMDTTDFQVD